MFTYDAVSFFNVLILVNISLGANLLVVADLISDTIEQVTKTYAHLIEEDRNKVLSKI